MTQQIYSIQLLNDLHNHFPELLYNTSRFQNIQDVLGYIRNVAEISPYTIGLQRYNSSNRANMPHINIRPAHNIQPNTTRIHNVTPVTARQPVAPTARQTVVPTTRQTISPTVVPTVVPNTRQSAVPNAVQSAVQSAVPNVALNMESTVLSPFNIRTNTTRTATTRTNNSNVLPTLVALYDEIPIQLQNSILSTSVDNNTNTLINSLVEGLFDNILENRTSMNTFLNERVVVHPTNDEIENASSRYVATNVQDDICNICQENFDQAQEIRRLTFCNHSFHRECVDRWFSSNVHCPTCRHDIREIDENQRTNQNNPPPVPENYRRTDIRNPDN
jgi:hypothetical protein